MSLCRLCQQVYCSSVQHFHGQLFVHKHADCYTMLPLYKSSTDVSAVYKTFRTSQYALHSSSTQILPAIFINGQSLHIEGPSSSFPKQTPNKECAHNSSWHLMAMHVPLGLELRPLVFQNAFHSLRYPDKSPHRASVSLHIPHDSVSILSDTLDAFLQTDVQDEGGMQNKSGHPKIGQRRLG